MKRARSADSNRWLGTQRLMLAPRSYTSSRCGLPFCSRESQLHQRFDQLGARSFVGLVTFRRGSRTLAFRRAWATTSCRGDVADPGVDPGEHHRPRPGRGPSRQVAGGDCWCCCPGWPGVAGSIAWLWICVRSTESQLDAALGWGSTVADLAGRAAPAMSASSGAGLGTLPRPR